MPYGFYGRLARIDLTTERTWTQPVAERDYRRFLGGSGLAFKLLFDEFDPGVEPLSAENPLMFIGGLLTGFSAPTSSRVSVVAKSPATGLWSEASVGGYWANMLVGTGYDGLIITGRSELPVYIWLTPDAIEIRPAGHLWGQQTYEVHDAIRAATHPKAEVACIGPAGEALVNLSGIMMGGHHTRAAGRGGLGAVMGAKNLKALAIWGDRRLEGADTRGLMEYLRPSHPMIRDYTKLLYDYGTPGAIPMLEISGDMPIKNWLEGNWKEGAANISGQHVAETILEGHQTCARCPIRCTKTVHVTKGPHAGGVSHQAEYETAAGFGALILNDDHELVAAANDLCNRLGLDTISVSSVCAWAYEVYEMGLITKADTLGLELTWGNGEALLGLIEQIGRRQGIGELLGRGVKQAAAEIGHGTADFAIHVKGLEMPYHDPRAFTSMAVVYATAVRGACHLEGLTYFAEGGAFPSAKIGLDRKWDPHGSEEKPELAKRMQDFMVTLNALGLCKFIIRGRQGPEEIATWIRHITGWEDMTTEELMRTGERLFNLKRLAGTRFFGISRKDDTLPPRLLTHARPTGGSAGVLPKLEPMLAEYYQLRGWDSEGRILPETLQALGLKEFAGQSENG